MAETDPGGPAQADLLPYIHDGIPAQETGQANPAAQDGRLRVVLLAPDPASAAPLLDRAREIASDLAARSDAGLRFLWDAGRTPDDPEHPPAAFLQGFTPSDLVVAADGSYVVHFAPHDAAWFMPGYWPALRYSAGHLPVGWTCES
ncbi:hypothetical protein LMG26842_03145 [Achromobacter dolens]|uniref:hypothetical protein n=1 Tax=Achromobacter dolens TaxID=1287738 RepID=UPI001465F495|nr:hypothetical protein [Achromobacter dolens]CAB3857063.1 hypothetical protein LMG26842_03145 [Achromobacter dolens]